MGNTRVLITGATGFTGGHLCERLAGQGYAVRALVRNGRSRAELERWGVEIAPGDLRDPESLRAATRDVDVVYHIGALFRPENVSHREMWQTNVDGTRALLEAALAAGVRRFVHCSTVGVHGDIRTPPATEDAPYAPGDRYQESKTEGERVVVRYMRDAKMPIVVFRPGGIYGPRDLRFLKLFRAIKSGRFVMLGSGRVAYQMIYVDDLVAAIQQCGELEQAAGNVYILTGPEPVTLNRLVEVIAGVLGVPRPRWHFPVAPVYVAGALCEALCKPFGIEPPLYRRRVDFFRKTRSFDISKARRHLGFAPSVDLETGIRRTAEWYRANHYL